MLDSEIDRVVDAVMLRLEPELETRFQKEREAVEARFEDVEKQRDHQHSENRARFQLVDGTTVRIETKVDRLSEGIMELLGEVREIVGHSKGVKESEEKLEKAKEDRRNALKWIVGLVAGSGIIRWLQSHFHWK